MSSEPREPSMDVSQANEQDTASASEVTVSINEEIHDIDDGGGVSTLDAESLEVATQPFVGRWNRLVSTTNWEKGRIILQWREALQEIRGSTERIFR